ncbi:AraC family transcriptional regulator [Vibrio sinaloensis]|uniref:AraC family transcriptional regulator n=1 Tax=Photobacterium sp. (strain ATCC 43367) TaxID=379097 RepID=UPI0022AF6D59|nr:AraC family transcriptional regulator [Vibrio sinaloensis]MCZ4293322.1 AraC family transcriptional regulator [Vibrio sinaloensis]
MHYAISFQSELYDFLVSTSRKKLLKHQLICVEKGLALVKLGKQEYAVEAGQSFWLPFDALTSITYTPKTLVRSVQVSSRVTSQLPKQGGYVELNELMTAVLNRLATLVANREAQLDLLAVLRQELPSLKPVLKESKLSQKINHWKVNQTSSLANELQLVLTVREACKQMKSGKKREQVVSTLFDGNESLLTGLEKTILGL